MSKTMKKFLVVLAIALCFISVQNVYAEDVTVTGTITAISTDCNTVIVNGIEFYGIKFNYLYNHYGIYLEVGNEVTITAHEHICKDGSIKLMATSITVGEVTVELR